MSRANELPQRATLQWLAVDLDGTLAQSLWTPRNPTSDIGDPIEANLAKLRDCLDYPFAKYRVVIHTARPWTDYERIEAWCAEHDVPIKGIVPGKLLAHRYIDDRAIAADAPSWSDWL